VTSEPEAKGAPTSVAEEEIDPRVRDPLVLDWVGKNLTRLRRLEQRGLYWPLGIAFVVGLVAHVGTYMLRSSAGTGLLGLMVELLYALGWALWTGVVVVVFVEIIPEIKRRQLKQALDAYEAAMRDQARAGSGHASGDRTPTAS
jgi:hypothetical protein